MAAACVTAAVALAVEEVGAGLGGARNSAGTGLSAAAAAQLASQLGDALLGGAKSERTRA